MKLASLLLLLLCLGFAAQTFLQPGHTWGGDFSLYIRQAQGLASQQAQRVTDDTRFMIENSTDHTFSPAAYPWGFPLILWPWVNKADSEEPFFAPTVFDLNTLKQVEIFCFLAFVLLFAFWAGHAFRGWVPLMLTAFVALQQNYLSYLNHILAEMPYLLFLMASMLAIGHLMRLWIRVGNAVRTGSESCGRTPLWSRHKMYLFTAFCTGILLLFTAQIRTEGFLLFGALGAAHAVEVWRCHKEGKKITLTQWIFLGTPYVGAALTLGVWSAVLPSGFLSHIDHSSLISAATLKRNALALFDGFGSYLPLPGFGRWIIALFLLIALVGWIKNLLRDTAPAALLALTLGLFLVWPHYEWRYLFSIFPFVAFFFVRGLEAIPLPLPEIVLPAVIIMLLLNIGLTVTRNLSNPPQILNGPCRAESQEMFSFIREKTAPSDVVAFFRPRVMCLYTQRKSLTLSGSFTDIAQKVQWYVVTIDQGTFYQFNEDNLARYRNYLKVAYRNQNFIVYQVLSIPPPQ